MNTQNIKNIYKDHFKEQLRQLQNKKFNGLNTQQIFSYVRIYYAIYTTVLTNDLDEEYGSSDIYLSKLKVLLKILIRRYNNTDDKVKKIQMLYMIFFIVENVLCTYDSEKYFNEGVELIDSFIEENHDTMTEAEQYELMRLILVEWYGLIEDDENDTPSSLIYAREQIRQWSEDLTNDGFWVDATDMQALRRIILIAMNSTLMLDDQYDSRLEKAYNLYCIIPTQEVRADAKLSERDLNKFILIAFALHNAPLSMAIGYTPYLSKLDTLIISHLDKTKSNPTLHSKCLCIHANNMCLKISDEIQEMLMKEE